MKQVFQSFSFFHFPATFSQKAPQRVKSPFPLASSNRRLRPWFTGIPFKVYKGVPVRGEGETPQKGPLPHPQEMWNREHRGVTGNCRADRCKDYSWGREYLDLASGSSSCPTQVGMDTNSVHSLRTGGVAVSTSVMGCPQRKRGERRAESAPLRDQPHSAWGGCGESYQTPELGILGGLRISPPVSCDPMELPNQARTPSSWIVAKAASVYDGERCCGPSLLPGAILSCLARGRKVITSEGKKRYSWAWNRCLNVTTCEGKKRSLLSMELVYEG